MLLASPVTLVLAFLLVLATPAAKADQFHYNNFLTGDRAIGMGGAYGGVSDDASGLFYNPAGLAFALNNDVSGSANALYARKIRYKKTVGNKDFEERSGGTVPSFFGGLQKLDSIMKGLVLGFGMYTTDGELKDQDDLIEHETLGQERDPFYDAQDPLDSNNRCNSYVDGLRTNSEGAQLPNRVLDRFHRTVNQRGSTFHAGAALGWRLRNTFAVGVGLNYVTIDELVQEYQDVRTSGASCKTNGDYTETVQQLAQNIRQHLVAYGVQPVLSMQASLWGRLSMGLAVKMGSYVSQSFDQAVEQRQLTILASDQEQVDSASAQGGSHKTTGNYADVYQNDQKKTYKNPLGRMPLHSRLGLAYFASTRLLTTFDMTYTAGVKGSDTLDGTTPLFGKNAVTNLAAGMEYYLVPAIPLRLGLFTNNDARSKIDHKKQNQRDHIDYVGGTIFLAWVQPNSQIGAGVVLQKGQGEAQKVAGSEVQKVEAQSYTFAFSATHSF